jgi:putative transposase
VFKALDGFLFVHCLYSISLKSKKGWVWGSCFSSVVSSSGIQEIKTPFRAPEANVICERFMRSLTRECLDQILVLHPRQLKRAVTEFLIYYNESRAHKGI